MQGMASCPEKADKALHDTVGEEGAPRRREQRKGHSSRIVHREPIRDRLAVEGLICHPEQVQGPPRGGQPDVIRRRDREVAGLHIVPGAEIRPEPLPSPERLADHAGVAVVRAVGIADDPVTVDRRGAGARQAVLLVDHGLVSGAGESPGRGQPHDAGTDDNDPHAWPSRWAATSCEGDLGGAARSGRARSVPQRAGAARARLSRRAARFCSSARSSASRRATASASRVFTRRRLRPA